MFMGKEISARALYSIALKALVLVLGLVGQGLGFARLSFMSGHHFLYYTNISNLAIVLLMIILLVYALRGLKNAQITLPAFLSGLRFALCAGILLTFVVFTLLLMPMMQTAYLTSPDNILVHNLVPLLACLDFILFDDRAPKKRHNVLLGLLLPALYLVFSFALTLSGVSFFSGSAPYFFLDFKANGWFRAGEGSLGVFWWILIILALQLVLSRVLLGLKDLVQKNRD